MEEFIITEEQLLKFKELTKNRKTSFFNIKSTIKSVIIFEFKYKNKNITKEEILKYESYLKKLHFDRDDVINAINLGNTQQKSKNYSISIQKVAYDFLFKLYLKRRTKEEWLESVIDILDNQILSDKEIKKAKRRKELESKTKNR